MHNFLPYFKQPFVRQLEVAYLALQHASRHPRVDGSILLFDLLRSAVIQLPPAVAWNHPLFT